MLRSPASRWSLPLALVVILSMHLGQAQAEDDKRAVQMREAARSAQAALQRAQQELVTVKSERDRLAQEDQARKAELVGAQARERVVGGQLASLKASLAQAAIERERIQAELAAALDVQVDLKSQGEKSQADALANALALEEQRRITQALSGLLERSVKSLAAAELANRQLLALGLQAVDAYVQATPEAVRARDEPFLGLAAVTLENRAETIRRALAEQRVVP